MFGHRTPVKQKPTVETPSDPPQIVKKSPIPVPHSSHTTSVRRSIGEWEHGKSDTLLKSPTYANKTKPAEPPKPKPKPSTSQVQPRIETRRESTEAAGNLSSLQNRSHKYTDRLVEAKACLDTATEHLKTSRNTKKEIVTEVKYALNRLYQLVKEGESGKKQVSVQEKSPETVILPGKPLDEGELSRKLEENSRLLQESNERMEKLRESLDRESHDRQKSYASVAAVLLRGQSRPRYTLL